MKTRKRVNAKTIASQLVAPGFAALKSVHSGMIGMQDTVNLGMMGVLSRRAGTRGLPVPDVTPQVQAVVGPVAAALRGDGKVELDHDVLMQAEAALSQLRNAFSKVSTYTLSALVNDLILSHDIRTTLLQDEAGAEA